LPHYEWQGADLAMQQIHQRAASIQTVAASGQLVLTRPDGSAVTFEGALAAQGQGHFRLRGWKFGHAILDLTVRPDGFWIWLDAPEGGGDAELASMSKGMEQASAFWPFMTGDIPSSAHRTVANSTGRCLELRLEGWTTGGDCVVTIDRQTLTVRRYRVLDPSGKLVQSVRLEQYRMVKELVWPMRIIAEGPQGKMEINLDQVALNEELPASAFVPPRRASKRP
jgi:hypothetical protein